MSGKGRIVWMIVVSTVVFGVVAAIALVGEVREFHLEEIEVRATVLPDRSMLVTERVTYRFEGADDQPFTVASRSWDRDFARRWRIVDPVASENGTPRRTVLSTSHLFEWDIAPARSGTRTYDLTYRVVDAVEVWQDTAELYWNWIGRNEPGVARWSATIELPRRHDGEVRAWAHGPLDGVIHVEPDRIVSEVDDVPAGQFVDNRVLMPVEWFDGPPSPELRLDDILTEEAANAEDANRQRLAAERAEARRERARNVLSVVMVPLVAAAAGAFWWIWRRWGKDPPRPDDIGDYWREVPDDPPAVGAALLKWRIVDSDAYSGTIMDLARRGHLVIEEYEIERRLRSDRLSYRFVKTESPETEQLLPFERRLLKWIFPSGEGSVTQDELVAKARKDPERAHKFWTDFQKEVKAELDRRNYLVRGKGLAFTLHALVVIVPLLAGGAALALGAWIPGILGIVAGLVLAPLGILHRSRTPAGTRRHAEWKGLKKFLADFSTLDDAPVGHLVLWEHYLVAATALGVADQLVEGLRQRFPEVADAAMSSTSWYAATAGRPAGAGFAGFGSTFGAASVSSFSPPSSSSGGGGGFSSGGGGGGGGGGFGAR